MKKMSRVLITLVIVIFAQMFSGVVGVDEPPPAQAATSNQIIFTLNGSQNPLLVVLHYALTGVTSLLAPNTFLATLPLGVDAGLVADLMNLDPLIAAASPNYTVSGYTENRSSFNFDPNSFYYDGDKSSAPYALDQARNQWAWQRTQLLANQRADWGSGVKVAVLDTGVDYNHPELKGKVLNGYDAVKGYGTGMDVQGHGTFVAGVITQVAPGATIIPVRVLDENGNGSVANIMNGLQYAIDAGAKVVNLSLSSTYDFKVLHLLIQIAKARGVVVVSAAGNDNSANRYYPAAYSEDLGIGATNNQDYKASFSNYNPTLSLSAPGVAIYSMWKGGGYGWGDGTSFSTPMVAAGAAVVKSLHPEYSFDQLKTSLKNGVDSFGAGCSCAGLGLGRLNFGKLNLGT
jgi:subtilisin family serine protease